MENSHSDLDSIFAALGDPTRRAILGRLARRASASVSELAEPFAIKLPAVMKHLGVLEEAGLITRSKSGRVVTVRLRPGSMRDATAWLRRHELFWSARLDKLTVYAERKELHVRGQK
jgi:DNA-binding transcriptional ArsR family regulator